MEAFSLLEVNQFIKRVLALNFDEPFWVECEINQVSHSKGNVYLNLIEKAEDSDDVVAKNSATIWYRQYLFIKKKLDKLIDSILSEGIMVKLKVTLNYSERYGLSLNIEDIDPSYTFGQFEMNRQKIIEKLKQKDLLEKNNLLDLPLVIQRIAVISSSTAAGFQDFKQQLFENEYGYEFDLVLYQSAMQGQKTEGDIVAALKQIRARNFDAIVIIRGGGSKLDLSSFDNYNIAFEIAMTELPVITGIGHDIDMTVTDMVAHTVLKTPTAVADMIISHNVHFESTLLGIESELFNFTTSIIAEEYEQLDYLEERLRTIPEITLSTQFQLLDNISDAVSLLSQSILKMAKAQLASKEELIASLNPTKVLERGYTIVRHKEKVITRRSALTKTAQEIEIEFHDGTLKAKI